jgi:GT2 family glycosyltransferase
MIPIIVVRYKQPVIEARCLAAVEQHTAHDLAYVCEVDNAPHNHSLSKVWNDCIFAHASALKWVVLLNSDCFVTPGWLSELLAVGNTSSKIAAVGPMTDHCGSRQKVPAGYDPSPYKATAALHHHLSGFCLLLRVDAWREAGGFDLAAPLYGQESALIEKCWHLGWETAIAPGVWVEHLGGASMKAAQQNGELDWEAEKKMGGEWILRYVHDLRKGKA